MDMKKKALGMMLIWALGAAPAFAQVNDLIRDPASMGMGAVTAVAPTFAYSALGNPAYAPFGEGMFDFELSGGLWEPSYPSGTTGLNFGAAGNLQDRYGYSFALAADLGNPYTISSADGVAGEQFTPGQMMFCAGFGMRFLQVFSVGASLSYCNRNLAVSSFSHALAGTASLMFQSSGIRATIGVKELGAWLGNAVAEPLHDNAEGAGSATSEQGSAAGLGATPARAFAGVGYTREFGAHRVEAAAQADYYLAGGLLAGAGASYCWKSLITARAGYILGGSSPYTSAVTFGLGAKVKGVHLDAAYLLAPAPVGNSFSIGLGFTLQRPKERPAPPPKEE